MSTLQWDLLRGVAPSGEAGTSRNRGLATSLEESEFTSILTSDEARAVLSTPGLLDGLVASPSNSTSTTDAETTLIVAIALLHAFVQTNWTGPDLDFTPFDLFPGQSTTAEDINA